MDEMGFDSLRDTMIRHMREDATKGLTEACVRFCSAYAEYSIVFSQGEAAAFVDEMTRQHMHTPDPAVGVATDD